MNTSLEAFILYKFPMTRNFLYNLLGKKEALEYQNHFSSVKQLFKFWGVIFGLIGLEIFTQYLGFQYILYQRNLIAEAFDEIYGPEAQKWDEHTKNEYKKQQSDLLYSNYSRGLMTNVSHKINFESLYAKFVQYVK